MTKLYTQNGLLASGGVTRELATASASIGASGDVITITPASDRRVVMFYAQSLTTSSETGLTLNVGGGAVACVSFCTQAVEGGKRERWRRTVMRAVLRMRHHLVFAVKTHLAKGAHVAAGTERVLLIA